MDFTFGRFQISPEPAACGKYNLYVNKVSDKGTIYRNLEAAGCPIERCMEIAIHKEMEETKGYAPLRDFLIEYKKITNTLIKAIKSK